MHVIKFDKDYTRRQCLESLGKSVVSAGILMPLFDAWANSGDIRAAYPDEALQLETYSKGAVKPGAMLDASNVDAVKDLLDPVTFRQIKQQGRVARIKATTTDMMQLNPMPFLQATERNAGQARLDDKGNVVVGDGKPWVGGIPFPQPDTALKIVANRAINWGRHDQSAVPTRMDIMDGAGASHYAYDFLWVEVMATGRTFLDPKPYMPGHEDKLRFVNFLSTYPTDQAGAASLNIWSYDQTRFPQLYVYVPSYKRIRRTAANKRFEPFMPGSSMSATDMCAIGDPYMTWGNFTLVGKAPFLGSVTDNWNQAHPNWEMDRAGGSTGRKFPIMTMELVPEALIIEMQPTRYNDSNISKKRIWLDARTCEPLVMLDYGLDGTPWKYYTTSNSVYSKNGQTISETHPQPSNIPYFSWCGVFVQDLKADTVTFAQQVKQINGGYSVRVNDPYLYDQFCTVSALQNLGT